VTHTHGTKQPQKSSQLLKHAQLLNSLVSFKPPRTSLTSVRNSKQNKTKTKTKRRHPTLTETERKQIAQMPAVAGMGAIFGF